MTTALISKSLINKLEPKSKQYDVRDSSLKGFMVRVHPSGSMTYAVQYKRGGRVTLGKVGVMALSDARNKAAKIIGDYAEGLDPKQAEAQKKGIPTLGVFLEEYEPWVKTHNESGGEAIKSIHRHFSHLLDVPLDQIKPQDIDKWRTKKLETDAMKPNTITRTITPLRSAISQAVKWGILKQHSLAGLASLKYDDTRVRYLDEQERGILFKALDEREQGIKVGRKKANEWRKSRGYELYPEIKDSDYADHLLPMAILALNTGVRLSEEKRLKRANINFKQKTLFVEKSKNGLSRYVPLNETAIEMLKIWMDQTKGLNNPYLFPSPVASNKPISSIKTAWTNLKEAASIENLHWHDLRHDFASRLVMKNVSLYTVQRLLGHKRIDQTMKYAHLAPDFIAEAVRQLD